MLTYHAPVIPTTELVPHGVYLNDPHTRFDPQIIVYDEGNEWFVGLSRNDMMEVASHHNLGGDARPVQFLDTICSIEDLEPYIIEENIVERPHIDHAVGRVTINNWELFNYLEEYETACDYGLFDG